MALVVQLKKGEALKIGDQVIIVSASRGARIVLDAPKDVKIERLGVLEDEEQRDAERKGAVIVKRANETQQAKK
jgi:sRNA-binding carbon storage regulator CsrA